MKLSLKSTIKAFVFILVFYIFFHVFALIGIFLAIIYLFVWLIAPKKTPSCIWQISKKSGPYPKNFLNCLHNVFFILSLTFISFLFVYLESRLLLSLNFPTAPKTAVFVIPQKGQYRINEIFPLKIEVSGIKKPINAVKADISFDPEKLEIIEISTNKSFAGLFLEKEICNELGFASLAGGLPNPGFSGQQGLFGTIYFQAKNPGIAQVEFLPSSLVLANDGHGTNILSQLSSVNYLILDEKISEEEKINQHSFLEEKVLGREAKEDKSEVLGETQLKFYSRQEESTCRFALKKKEIKQASNGKRLFNFIANFNQSIFNFWLEKYSSQSTKS